MLSIRILSYSRENNYKIVESVKKVENNINKNSIVIYKLIFFIIITKSDSKLYNYIHIYCHCITETNQREKLSKLFRYIV